MGQSTTVATAFTAIMIIAGVSILVISTVSSFGVISKGIDNMVAQNEAVLNEDFEFTSWSLVDPQTLRLNVTNTGQTSIRLRDFDKMDCIVTYTVSGTSNSTWVPYVQTGHASSHWNVTKVFFNGMEGDEVNPVKLMAPVYGGWDPCETLEIQIWLEDINPSFLYVTLVTPDAVKASTDLYMEYEVGVATVTTGDTYVDVAHSLGRTPKNVQATPQVDLGGTGFWVSDVDSSKIRINIGSSLGFDAPFYWRIE
jgi:archaellum component FlaF (FlaF/FlaG flagellin family)